ncbi:MAG: hypothetical protein SCARUB_05169 [Candidatus Scalindua rubra]|uniref:Uncharacterized protein n=1 Tax=Candidatus Scalindua rubra TaxID=1872076 RepID=A0A1E3X277_9BACT|nr:MAG: hypothetical protein SCARUB_05169 [Candidatus Scalindua rubra]
MSSLKALIMSSMFSNLFYKIHKMIFYLDSFRYSTDYYLRVISTPSMRHEYLQKGCRIHSSTVKAVMTASRLPFPRGNRPKRRILIAFSFFKHPVTGLCKMTGYRPFRLLIALSLKNSPVKLAHMTLRFAHVVKGYTICSFRKGPFQIPVYIRAQSPIAGLVISESADNVKYVF